MSVRLKQISLAALTGFLALNVWTGAPLLALWLGSRVQGEGPPSMAAVAVVIVTLIAICLGLYQALKRTSAAYDGVTGQTPSVRTHAPWMRSMRDEEVEQVVTPIERIVVLMVLLAAAAFNVWFFFFSGSSIGSG